MDEYKSYAQALDLVNDKELIEEYKKYHRGVWKEVNDALSSIGIKKMKIFLIGTHLFMYYEARSDFDPKIDFQKYTELTPKANEWDNLMRKFQQKISDVPENQLGEWWTPMDLVYDLDWFIQQ